MFKHTSNDCNALKLALCLAIILPATRAFTFKPPDNLYSVNAQGKLEKFKLTVEHFKIEESPADDGKIYYGIFLTAPKRTILVVKNPINKNPEKLEDSDGAIIIGPGSNHSVGFSNPVEPINHSGPFDLWSKLEDAGKEYNLSENKHFARYDFEDFPPNLVEELTGNNSTIFELLNSKYFNSEPEKYFEMKNMNPLTPTELTKQFKAHTLQNVGGILDAFLQGTIYPRRDELKNSYFCMNFINKCAHTENATLFKNMMEYIEVFIDEKVDSNVAIVFDKYYKENVVPLFSEEGIKSFIINSVKPRELNLIIEMINNNYKGFFQDYKNYNLAVGVSQYADAEHSGNNILENMLYQFLVNVREKATPPLIELFRNSKGAKFAADFKATLKDSVDGLNKLLKREYKVSFSAEEKEEEQLVNLLFNSADFMGFVLNNISKKVRATFEAFIFNYISISANYTMLNELILIAPDFNNNDYETHVNTLLNKKYAKAASTLNDTTDVKFLPMSTPMVFGEPKAE